MRIAASLLLALLLGKTLSPPEPAIPFFSNVRDVHIAQPDRQNFFIVDAEIWGHSRPDLGDLRLYDADSPVQYELSEQRAGTSSEEVEAKILNLGSVAGHTEFDLDTQGLAEYDRIRLRLDARDFVAKASVSGGSAPGKASEVELTPSTLYDFTKEQLGSNSVLKLRPSSFRYLHIKLSPGILPQQVKGATIANLREQQASWTKAGSCSTPQAKQRKTEITCEMPAKVPLNRILFRVEPSQVNFRRAVSVEDGDGMPVALGEISRVRVNRAGTQVTNEELAVNAIALNMFAVGNVGNSGHLIITIDNGDNPPLAILGAEPLFDLSPDLSSQAEDESSRAQQLMVVGLVRQMNRVAWERDRDIGHQVQVGDRCRQRQRRDRLSPLRGATLKTIARRRYRRRRRTSSVDAEGRRASVGVLVA